MSFPAQISEEQSEKVQELATKAFKVLDCSGVARVDVLMHPDGEIFLNEINTIPGSLSSYLWEASDLPFSALLDRIIELALERSREKRRSRYTAAPA